MKTQLNKLIAAVECAQALDMPFEQGLKTLTKHGFDYSNRFDLPVTEFVENLQNEALSTTQP